MKSSNSVSKMLLAWSLGMTALGCSVARADTLSEARDSLPASIKSSHVLRVAGSTQWAPFGYVDEGGKMTGIDIEFIRLLASKLGLEVQFTDLPLASIVPGIATGRYDVGVDQIGITDERKKAVDFVPYFTSQWSLVVKNGSPMLDINHLCGQTMGVTQGSQQAGLIDELSAQCVASSDKPIEKLFYPSSADTYMAVANGRGDGFIAGKAAAIYMSRVNTNLTVSTTTLDGHAAVAGIAVSKQNTALGAALTVARDEAVKDGSYLKILEKYGVPEGAYAQN